VEGTIHNDDVGSPGGHTSQLDGILNSFSATVGEEEAVEGGIGHDLQEAIHEVEHGAGEAHVGLGVNNLLQLLLGSLHHTRVAVTSVGDSNSGGVIEKLSAILHLQIAALASLHGDGHQTGHARMHVFCAPFGTFLLFGSAEGSSEGRRTQGGGEHTTSQHE